MRSIILAVIVATAHTAAQDAHHARVRCGHRHACIIQTAQWECRHWRDPFHCRIARRWQRRLDSELHWFRAREAAAGPEQAAAIGPAPTPAPSSSTDLADVPGVPPSFAACVAMRESTDGAGSPNIYGILPMNGYYDGMGLAAQKELFAQMYAAQGTAPWSSYDGC